MSSTWEMRDFFLRRIDSSAELLILEFTPSFNSVDLAEPAKPRGFAQTVEVQISNYVVAQKKDVRTRDLTGGRLVCAEQTLTNAIPLPFEHDGAMNFFLEYSEETIEISGDGIRIDVVGHPVFDINTKANLI